MTKSAQEGFIEVRTKIYSIYDVVLKRSPESANVQEFASINTKPRLRNVQIPPTVIDAEREELNTSLQQLQDISSNIKVLSMQKLVHMKRVSN